MTIESPIPYWTSTEPVDAERRLRDCLSVLANWRQRAILRVLAESGRSLPTAVLVTRLAAVGAATASEDHPADEAAVEISLAHVDLPQLTAAGFVTTSRDPTTVRLGEHSLLDDPDFERLLRDETWDDPVGVMAVERHRRIRAILAAHLDPLPLNRLAALVAAHESPRLTHPLPDSSPTDSPSTLTAPPKAAVTAMLDALHHVHLPALEAAGLVVYDPEAGTVDASSAPDSDDMWQPPEFPPATDTRQYPVDCTAEGVAIRLVVSPDGHIEDAYAYAASESAVRTVAVPSRPPTTRDPELPATSPTDEPAGATPQGSTTSHREQWLVDCWLRHSSAA